MSTPKLDIPDIHIPLDNIVSEGNAELRFRVNPDFKSMDAYMVPDVSQENLLGPEGFFCNTSIKPIEKKDRFLGTREIPISEVDILSQMVACATKNNLIAPDTARFFRLYSNALLTALDPFLRASKEVSEDGTFTARIKPPHAGGRPKPYAVTVHKSLLDTLVKASDLLAMLSVRIEDNPYFLGQLHTAAEHKNMPDFLREQGIGSAARNPRSR